jgi:hypothetical protein
MKLAYVLLAFALLTTLTLSAPASDGEIHRAAGEAIDSMLLITEQEHLQNAGAEPSEKVFVGSIKSDKYRTSLKTI